jgi:hypothetical protein
MEMLRIKTESWTIADQLLGAMWFMTIRAAIKNRLSVTSGGVVD